MGTSRILPNWTKAHLESMRMITLSLVSPPDYERTLRSEDVRELCIRAENTMRLWLQRGRSFVVSIEGGTTAQREHVRWYLDGVRAEVAAVPVRARSARR
jgi:hypothetical protein